VNEVHISQSEEETEALGRALAARLEPGDVVLLSGNLGSGKTTFVRGMAEGIGVASREVSSPTFTLVHEYRGGRVPLFHADLYRLERVALDELGLEELRGEGVLVIEWPDRLDYKVQAATTVRLHWVSETARRIHIERGAVVGH
jgi:tRNA threonylcarbamoyladenosine biosynthesis protein TsaE